MSDRIDLLEQLAELRRSGALTQDEFESQKRKLFGDRASPSSAIVEPQSIDDELVRDPNKPIRVVVAAAMALGIGVLVWATWPGPIKSSPSGFVQPAPSSDFSGQFQGERPKTLRSELLTPQCVRAWSLANSYTCRSMVSSASFLLDNLESSLEDARRLCPQEAEALRQAGEKAGASVYEATGGYGLRHEGASECVWQVTKRMRAMGVEPLWQNPQ